MRFLQEARQRDVLRLQLRCLYKHCLFGDGGILAFGANCFNMAFMLAISRICPLQIYLGKDRKKKVWSRQWVPMLELMWQHFVQRLSLEFSQLLFTDAAGKALYCPYPLTISIPAMMIGHLTLFGIAEIVLTTAILAFVEKISPETLEEKPAQSAFKPLYILMAVLIIFTPLGLLASGTAWGEWGVEEMASLVSNGKALGYTPAGMEKGFSLASLFPDYSMAGMPEWIGYILSAVVGVAIIVIFFKLLAGSKKDKIDFSKGQSV